jgi:Rrf2 family protein
LRLELSNKTDIAKRVMTFLVLHADDKALKGATLAEWVDTTIHYLPQVMRPLIDAGWIESVPGPNGGYRATEQAGFASMRELIEAVEGPIENGRCVLRGAPCPATEKCGMHDAWSRARAALIAELQSTPIVYGAAPDPSANPSEGRHTRE